MIQQALTEGLLPRRSPAALAGLLLARWGVSALVGLAPADLPRVHEIAPDARMLWITLGVSLVTGVFVGLLPAITRIARRAACRAAGKQPRHRRRRVPASRARGAGRRRSGTGGDADDRRRAAAAQLRVAAVGQPRLRAGADAHVADEPAARASRTQDERTAFYREFLDRMKALPGVVSVGGTSRLPLGSTGLDHVDRRRRTAAPDRRVARGAVPARHRRLLPDDGHSDAARGGIFNDADGATAPPRLHRQSDDGRQAVPG